jgi:hypothetical protein
LKLNLKIVHLMAILLFLSSCQAIVPAGQTETQVAATIYAEQASLATSEAVKATLTSIAPVLPTQTPASLETVFNFNLPAGACWTTSEVNVLTGQTVSITASGIVNTWGGNEISNGDPNGQSANMCGAIECPLQGANYGALIGRLEDLQPFLVGTSAEFTATKDGEIYFTVNDWECLDNSGSFDIVIEVN